MTIENDGYSRKEMSGWGDSRTQYQYKHQAAHLTNQINPDIEQHYSHIIEEVVDTMLAGLHLEEHSIPQRKYFAEQEDTVLVDVPIKSILMKRALKKLTSLIN